MLLLSFLFDRRNVENVVARRSLVRRCRNVESTGKFMPSDLSLAESLIKGVFHAL